VKKILILAFVLLMGFIVLNRQRVFVRDPLASVYRSDTKQSEVQVYINYSNDVLLVKEGGPDAYRTLVQRWSKMPGTPVVLTCIRWMACLTQEDQAPIIPPDWSGQGPYDPQVSMTERGVSFVDHTGAKVFVEFR
jgi:hypothetical protein